jgi:tRNA threonylcarbamoyladenosine biosynthesis protein TsaB
MIALSMETASSLGGVAVMDSEAGLLAEVRLNVKATHSERLMEAVQFALAQCGLAMADVDVIAVSVGPGTFTGLRIGLGTAKGLAFAGRARGVRCVAVPTLLAYASAMPYAGGLVAPMLDARKGEIYTSVYQPGPGGAMKTVVECRAVPARDLAALISREARDETSPVLMAGPGAAAYRAELEATLGGRARMAPPHLMVPSPAAVAAVGLAMAARGEFADPRALVPLYQRRTEAEINRGA